MTKFILRWAINAIALYLAVLILPGIDLRSDLVSILWLALIFGLINALFRPLIQLLTCPLIILTLGLFTLVIMKTSYTLTERDAPAGQLLSVLASDVSRCSVTFLFVVKINNTRVEWDHVAHLIDENLECVLDVQRRTKRAGNLIQRIDFAMRLLDLIVSDIRATLASLIHIDFAQLNWRLGRVVGRLVLQAEPRDLRVETRQVLDELLDHVRIEMNSGATQ